MVSPTLDQELHHQLQNLPLTQQRQVLGFALLPFAGTIAPDDLAIMAQAADEDCEHISSEDWYGITPLLPRIEIRG
ncbi:MAG: hypothetical protein M3Y28_06960 [Armatimonadota bacterium]|nr:hypothetical protein [Armatimonadota bacterium]